jgi:hypothetical protein
MAGVFISYRREDSPGHAGRLFDALRARLGSDLVFMDVCGIDAGVDFVRVVEREVASCDALLAIIGPDWLSSAADPDGHSGLHDPDDFVRLEIGIALQRDVRVVPVLVDKAKLPDDDELPDELKALTRRNAVELRDSRWDADVNELLGSLETFITGSVKEHTAFEQHGSPVARARWRHRWMGAAGVAVLLGAGAIVGLRGRVADSTGDTRTVSASSDAGRPSSGSGETSADTHGVSTTRGDAARGSSHRGVGIGWFGVWLGGVTTTPPGVIVGEVTPGGPAAIAGIVEKDVLVEIAGQSLDSYSAVADAVVDHVKSTPRGTPGVVHVMRNGVPHQFMVVFDREFDLTP